MNIRHTLLATVALASLASTTATAQSVPAIDTQSTPSAAQATAAPQAAPAQTSAPQYPTYAPPALAPTMGANPRLTARERASVEIADSWVSNASRPATGTEGAVLFGFGETLPSLVCAPLHVCSVMLQKGEVINDINLGDSVRWRVSPARSGTGINAVTHIMIKPTDAGLQTNLVVTTDRRTYVLKLVSHRTEWMPRVAFTYPDEVQAEWENFLANQRAEQATAEAMAMDYLRATVIPEAQRSVADLDFGFRLQGDNPSWKPLRVYSDGSKTYIQFPAALENSLAPALVAVGPGDTAEVVNYRIEGNRYVVDHIIDRAALISGVGRRQVRVDIVRGGE